MGQWILIVMVYMGGGNLYVTSTTAEFNSKETCEAAGEKLQGISRDKETWYKRIDHICTQK